MGPIAKKSLKTDYNLYIQIVNFIFSQDIYFQEMDYLHFAIDYPEFERLYSYRMASILAKQDYPSLCILRFEFCGKSCGKAERKIWGGLNNKP